MLTCFLELTRLMLVKTLWFLYITFIVPHRYHFVLLRLLFCGQFQLLFVCISLIWCMFRQIWDVRCTYLSTFLAIPMWFYKVWERAEEFLPERFDLEGPVPNETNTDFRYCCLYIPSESKICSFYFLIPFSEICALYWNYSSNTFTLCFY